MIQILMEIPEILIYKTVNGSVLQQDDGTYKYVPNEFEYSSDTYFIFCRMVMALILATSF